MCCATCSLQDATVVDALLRLTALLAYVRLRMTASGRRFQVCGSRLWVAPVQAFALRVEQHCIHRTSDIGAAGFAPNRPPVALGARRQDGTMRIATNFRLTGTFVFPVQSALQLSNTRLMWARVALRRTALEE